MALITKEIKDEYVTAIALKLGYFPSPDDTIDNYLAAIQSRVDELIDPLYESIVAEQDPDIIAKAQELEVLKVQKVELAREITVKEGTIKGQ